MVVVAAHYGTSATMTLYRFKQFDRAEDACVSELAATIEAHEHHAAFERVSVAHRSPGTMKELAYLSEPLKDSRLGALLRGDAERRYSGIAAESVSRGGEVLLSRKGRTMERRDETSGEMVDRVKQTLTSSWLSAIEPGTRIASPRWRDSLAGPAASVHMAAAVPAAVLDAGDRHGDAERVMDDQVVDRRADFSSKTRAPSADASAKERKGRRASAPIMDDSLIEWTLHGSAGSGPF